MLHYNASNLGYYCVGDKLFNHKVPALIHASETNQRPRWIFHNDVFDTYNWQQEPTQSLQELYRKKAQQLRDKYDYLVLYYSGGSDSHNILMTFINNNIKLDEVYVYWPVSASEKKGANNVDVTVDNIASEWGLTVKPRLRWLAANCPDIKITIKNWSADLQKIEISDDFILNRNHNFSVYGEFRCRNDQLSDSLIKKRGAVILGIDKPLISIHNGEYKLMFMDNCVQACFPECEHIQHDIELFYWSAESCDLIAKQAHEVVRFFESNPQYQRFIMHPMKIPGSRQVYESSVRSVIYPDINTMVFQVDKSPNMNHSYDVIVKGTELEESFNHLYARGWNLVKELVKPEFCGVLNNEYTIMGISAGMWTIKKQNAPMAASIM